MKTRSKIRIPMPARYVINLALVVGFYFLLTGLISSGIITNYWTGILITVGINIILAVSLNIATGYLGQLPLGHAGFMAVGAYAGGIFMKATPAAALLKEGNTAALIPYILAAIVISAVVAGIFGVIIGIPALRLRGDYLPSSPWASVKSSALSDEASTPCWALISPTARQASSASRNLRL